VPDEEARLAALRSGQATYAALGPLAAQRLKADKSLTVLSSAGPWQQVTILNTRRRPFDDARVRQAIALTVDRQAAIERVLHGEGRLTGPIPTGLGTWAIPPDRLPYRRDLARARELLAEAGYPNGFEATIRTSPDAPTVLSTAALLADQVREIGITINIEPMALATLTGAIGANDFDLIAWRAGPMPDPDGYLSRHATNGHGAGALGASAWESARYDEIVEQARTIMDPGVRGQLYNEAAGILLDEAPLIWWFTENTLEAMPASVKGYSQSFSGRRTSLKKTWLER
jgi:peptide/nickel transport system substrate-binding protein